jgi:hypothetical protein
MIRVLALAMDAPGRYVVGHSESSDEEIAAHSLVALTDAAQLTVMSGTSVLTPIDVLHTFHAHLNGYIGYGELNADFTMMYEAWLDMRRNPPDFEVEEDE